MRFLGAFFSQHDDHLHMFTVEDVDEEQVEECSGGLYPTLDESLDSFNTTEDVESDCSRDQINNYEWADDIDVINVLHGVSDWPTALQVRSGVFAMVVGSQTYVSFALRVSSRRSLQTVRILLITPI